MWFLFRNRACRRFHKKSKEQNSLNIGLRNKKKKKNWPKLWVLFLRHWGTFNVTCFYKMFKFNWHSVNKWSLVSLLLCTTHSKGSFASCTVRIKYENQITRGTGRHKNKCIHIKKQLTASANEQLFVRNRWYSVAITIFQPMLSSLFFLFKSLDQRDIF